jgi:DNA polymerase I-like protein with 3'-5' exonuclease and polymerase domains
MEFPSLQGQGYIGIDTEEYDPDLKAMGPGENRDGRVVGISVATEAGFSEYYPIGHECGENLPPRVVGEWLNRELSTDVPKVGANLIYDLCYLPTIGVEAKPPFYDIQIAEPLLNENKFRYDLDSIAQEHIGETKNDAAMEAWIIERFGKKNPKGNIWRCPPEIVRPYAKWDASAPLRIFREQEKKLKADDLWQLFLLESELIPMLVAMRQRGVAVDLPYVHQLLDELRRRQEQKQAELNELAGGQVDVWAVKTIFPVFDALGLQYPLTPKTQKPSITASLLENTRHPVAEKILEVRKMDKLCGTFLEGSIIEKAVRGRIHCQFKQVKGEIGGTVSGRFSSSSPNLQFIPVRTEEGKMIRSAFKPDPDCDWYKLDFSQIEYRLIVHDAAELDLPRGREIAEAYWTNPDIDFHRKVAAMVWGEDLADDMRGRAKTINFGLAYGEGVDKLCHQLGLSRPDGEELLDLYHTEAPFIRKLSRGLQEQANRTGRVTTLLGRIRHYDSWEFRKSWREEPIILKHPIKGARRAFTHTAMNSRTQGSAADVMKKAMRDVWRSGACAVVGAPHLTVHDELDFSVPRTREAREAMAEIKHIMETCVKLMVPLKVDASTGIDWGKCK